MTVLALGAGDAVLAWLTVVVALVGALAAVVLLTRVVRPALEIKGYADHILDAGVAIAGNLDGLDELERTRELAAAAPAAAERALAGSGRTDA